MTDIELAAFADGTSSSRSIEEMQAHLASCDDCRELLVEVSGAIGCAPAGQVRPRVSWRVVAAAAAVLILVLNVPRLNITSVGNAPPASSTERALPDKPDAIRTVLPTNTVSTDDKLQFIWMRDDGASYRLTLTDAAGAPIWETMTSDTAAALPATVRLPSGSRYYWYVDALRLDGTSVTSGKQAFETAAR